MVTLSGTGVPSGRLMVFAAAVWLKMRCIKGGGLKINDTTVTDEKMVLTSAALTPEGVIKLSLGKKRHVLLKPA